MGLRVGTMSDLTVLRRITVAQVPLAPAISVFPGDPAQRLLELSEYGAVQDFVVVNAEGEYLGMVIGEDTRLTLLEREALPLLVVAELLHDEFPTVEPDETLDVVLDKFSIHDVASLPVIDPVRTNKVLGMITRSRLMRCYREALDERQ
jgi:CBS domain-containing protein